jgi:hypothetical protein
MMLWIVVAYGVFTIFAQKETRYVLYWLPAFTFFAAAPWARVYAGAALQWLTAAVLLAAVGYQSVWAWTRERPYITGYEAVVQRIMADGSPGFVLFDGELHGNFIFYFRIHDPSRRGVVLRKALYVTRVLQEYGSRELVRERADIERLLTEFGVRYVVVDNSELRFASQRILRDVLDDSAFRLVGTFPIDSSMPRWRARQLLLYEHPEPPPRTATDLYLPMMTLRDDIRLTVNDLQLP